MIEEGSFRRDLYHRLNVVTIELPPLRERSEDIISLANHFIEEFNSLFEKSIKKINKELRYFFLAYPWPGNVRELRNVMERAVALTRYDTITIEDLPDKVCNFQGGTVFIGGLDPTELVSMEEIERRYMNHVLDAVGGNQTQAARILGIDRKTIHRKLKLAAE